MIITLWCGIGTHHSSSDIFSCDPQGRWNVTCTGWHLAVSWHHALRMFPPSSTEVLAVGADVLAVGADILGVGPPAVAGAANIALTIFPHPLPCLGVCLVLAIYNTNSCLLVNHPSAHYPRLLPNSIHTASSLFALSACFSLGCSIS